jgi:hypothetical protein
MVHPLEPMLMKPAAQLEADAVGVAVVVDVAEKPAVLVVAVEEAVVAQGLRSTRATTAVLAFSCATKTTGENSAVFPWNARDGR